MTERVHRLIAIGALCIGAATFTACPPSSTGIGIAMQEKDPNYPQTRQWTLGSIRLFDGAYGNAEVHVVDTAGVCLYVIFADSLKWEGTRMNTVAIPKTQLPKGAGCQ